MPEDLIYSLLNAKPHFSFHVTLELRTSMMYLAQIKFDTLLDFLDTLYTGQKKNDVETHTDGSVKRKMYLS